MAPLAGVLLFGVAGMAQADQQRRIAVVVNAPGFYDWVATGPRAGDYYRYDRRNYERRDAVYVPGYWTWHPPQVVRRDDYRYDPRYDRGPRHHGGKKDHGRHLGWDRDRRDHDD